MASTALNTATRPAVQRAHKHSRLRRWVSTWGRAGIIFVAFAFQLLLLVAVVTFLDDQSSLIFALQGVLAVIVALVILNGHRATTYKLAWIVPVLTLPLLGSAFYLLYGSSAMTKVQRERLSASTDRARDALTLLPRAELHPGAVTASVRRQYTFLKNTSRYRLFDDTDTTYYPLGELGFDAMIEAIGRADRYVFAEYFIVDEGKMLDRLMDALAAKAAEGVDVRFLYDDLGSFFTLPTGFRARCEEAGIAVIPVNPVGLGFTITFQNRDHRKILSVDGIVGFTGGINIADEYINEIDRFGHWKDTVLRLEGPGAWGLTVMFLQMWELASRSPVDYASFLPPAEDRTVGLDRDDAGLVAPFDDSPFDTSSLGWDCYQHLMQSATHSVDIFTPYLVLSDVMVGQLCDTAQSGIRVRIVVPGIPDKWYVSLATHSYYRPLMDAGVEIYEYTPGFIHAKSMLVDDHLGMVGTINFDFRSFYLHQECAVWMHQTSALAALRQDVEETIAVSSRVEMADLTDTTMIRRLAQAVLRVFAPLM
ncbi:phospholipase D-like domain-containing protein [Dietzia alimentaria]|uniref:phospholipase D-like domain-containing protein n=1 Tax=Dietzia alimentaria TaxID=665550 RepID=UPI0002D5D6B6|nr:phospholipase D-like domain-containing protein [Dietzia alimentaria]